MPDASPFIRRAEADDVPAMHAMHLASIRAFCAGHYGPEQLNAWTQCITPEAYLAGMERLDVRVAVRAGTMLGLCITDASERAVKALYVAPEAAGTGVGRALLDHAEGLLMDAGARVAAVESTLNAVGFYAANGYGRVADTVFTLPDGIALPCVRMEKVLG